MNVLLIDADDEPRHALVVPLIQDGHRPARVTNHVEALHYLAEQQHDVVIVATEVADQGIAWCQLVREQHSLPLLVVGDLAAVSDRVRLLDAGADDILTSPFVLAELMAHIRALGRRGQARRLDVVVVDGDTRIQLAARRVWLGAEEVVLTAREWAVLEMIARRRGQLVPRAEILEAVWGAVTIPNQATLDVIVGRVRKKLGGNLIRTLRGEGYFMCDESPGQNC